MKKKAQSTKENQSRNPQKPAVADETGSDIVQLILEDHKPLKELIKVLKSDADRSEKAAPMEEFAAKLTSHAKSEEKSLYVQMKELKKLRQEGLEGDTEHAIADQLVQEINATADDDEWLAKVKVLAELVEHHIEEEESEMLPDVEKQFSAEIRNAVGAEYTMLKTEMDVLFRPRPVPSSRITERRLN